MDVNVRPIVNTISSILDMAADRGAYVCQSQSMNVHIQEPNFGKLTSMHFYAWKKGLKTGMYYLRSKSAAEAIKFTVTKENDQMIIPANDKEAEAQSEFECIGCGS